jgi:hypothetical protein
LASLVFINSFTNLSRASSVFQGGLLLPEDQLLLISKAFPQRCAGSLGCACIRPGPRGVVAERVDDGRRKARLRPEICVGKLANGMSASMKSG